MTDAITQRILFLLLNVKVMLNHTKKKQESMRLLIKWNNDEKNKMKKSSTKEKIEWNRKCLTRNIFNWFLKSVSPNVIVAAHDILAFSNSVTKSFTANEWISSFCENVVTVSQPKRLINAIRAGLCDESGATVR